ncbi:MAG: ATP-binding cassette domain-containing protein [Candidatus Lokiarchaeota archaeon]|nr:ATP-binding cassette domain-containing protein [Candidatus Lokiarchaeota archaeon]
MIEEQCKLEEFACLEFGEAAKDPYSDARSLTPVQWILKHITYGSNKIILIVWLIFAILAVYFNSIIMFYIGEAVDIFASSDSEQLVPQFILILTIGLINGIFFLLGNLSRELLAQRMERDVRHEFYINLLGKSLSFHDQQQIGDIMSRATSDVRMLNYLISPALSLIMEGILTLLIPTILIMVNFPLQLLFSPLLFIILFVITIRDYFHKLGPITQQMRENMGQMHAVLNESLSGIEVVKELVREQREKARFLDYADKFRNAAIKEGKIQAKYYPLLFLGIFITSGLLHGLILNNFGVLIVGDIIAYVGLIMNFKRPTRISIWAFSIVTRAISAARRLISTMNEKSTIGQNKKGISSLIKGKIEFKNVDFHYPNSNKLVLKNLNFKVNSGETVAIVGTTGSGKTTLTKLIPRLYNTTTGKILIDDISIESYALEPLRTQISTIEQDIFLFRSSIFENISFGRVSTLKEVKKAAKNAQAHEFISQLKDQYQTKIGEKGVQLSGGEQQRIAIARAFITDPRILILDDSTSAIDSDTEDKIQRAIRNILKGRTTFLITHRLSQIRWADKILVMKNGKIDAQGTHYELMESSEEYRKIFTERFDVSINELTGGKS